MPSPEQLRTAIEQKAQSGHSAFTTDQLTDRAISEDSFLGQKINRAIRLGVSKKQALNFYAYGTSNGQLPEKKPAGFFEQIAQDVQSRRVQAGQDIEDFQNRDPGLHNTVEAASQLALRLPGRAAQAAGDIIGGLAAPLLQKTPEIVSGALSGVGIPEEVTQAQFNLAGKTLQQPLQSALKFYEGIDPNTRADVEAMASLGLAALDVAPGAAAAPKVMKGAAKSATTGIRGGTKAVFRPKTAEQLLPELDSVLGKVIQGDKESLEAAKSAFQMVDTQGARTYADLNQAFKEKIKALATKQNEILAASTEVRRLDDFAEVSRAGGQTATINHVSNAMDHLQEMYLKTGQMDDYVRMKSMREWAETEGLTPRQVNLLARQYGAESHKAFNPRTGDPLTSVNAQLSENTRKGLKEASRSMLPDDTSRMLDKQMSDILDTLRNTEIVEQKVRALAQKVNARGIGERIGRGLGRTLDLVTMGGLRGFVTSLFPSNVGLKTMNYLQIQDQLATNLNKIDDLLTKIDKMEPQKAADAIVDLIRSAQ